MDTNEYQKRASITYEPVDVSKAPNLLYPALGLANEAGEVLGKIKKIFRDKGGIISSQDIQDLKYELGDVLWYLSTCCLELGLSLAEVAESNIEKILDRQKRGVTHGEGDNR